MFKMFMRFNGWIALIPVVIGIGFLAISTTVSDSADRLDDEGVEVTGTIIDKQELERRGTNNTISTDYYVRFHFPLGDGTLHYGRRSVSSGFFDDVEVGMRVPIRFLPDDPDTNEVEPGAMSENAFYFMLLAGLITLAGGAYLFALLRFTRRAVRIRDNGARTEAVVETVLKAGAGSSVTFRYTDGNGAEHSKKSQPGRFRRIEDIQTGDRIRVRYDPDAPKHAFWVRDLGLETDG